MSDLMRKMSRYIIPQSIISILMGLILIIWAETAVMTIIYLIAAYVCIMGLMDMITYWRHKKSTSYVNSELAGGSFQIIIGVLIFLFPRVVVGILPLVLGIIILLNSVMNVARAFEIKKVGDRGWLFVLIASLVSAGVGILIIANPFNSGVVLIMICGIMMLAKGVIDLVTYFMFSKNFK